MKIIFLIPLISLIFLTPNNAYANIETLNQNFIEAKLLCKNGEYSKGINKIIDFAMDLRRKYPQNYLNKVWRGSLNSCYRKWVDSENKKCTKTHSIKYYLKINSIGEKSKVFMGKSFANYVKKSKTQCLNSLRKYHLKKCSKNNKSIKTLNSLAKLVKGKNLKNINKSIKKCLGKKWKLSIKNCKKTLGFKYMKEVYNLRKLLPKTKKYISDYKSCLKFQMEGGRDLCVKDMNYQKGGKILRKSFHLYSKLKSKKPGIIKKGKIWVKECGLYKLNLTFQIVGKSGGVSINLPGSANLIVTKDPVKGIKACGPIKFVEKNIFKNRCSTLITIVKSLKKPHFICLKGNLNNKYKDNPKIELSFDTKTKRPKITEKIQRSCKGKGVTIFKEKIFENFLTPKRLKIKITAIGASTKNFRIPLDLGSGRSFVLIGKWSVHFM
jgi:hypothetical protein